MGSNSFGYSSGYEHVDSVPRSREIDVELYTNHKHLVGLSIIFLHMM